MTDRDGGRYHNEELERMLENWRRYMTGEYRNPLGAKISSVWREGAEGGKRASYREVPVPLILGDFRDVDDAIRQLPHHLQGAIRVEYLERNATQRQRAWHCGLESVRTYHRAVDRAKRAIAATINGKRQASLDRRSAYYDAGTVG